MLSPKTFLYVLYLCATFVSVSQLSAMSKRTLSLDVEPSSSKRLCSQEAVESKMKYVNLFFLFFTFRIREIELDILVQQYLSCFYEVRIAFLTFHMLGHMLV